MPEQPADLYVYDEASVISASTKTVINDKNADLNATYGVQIAVFTMNTLPGEKSDYDGRVSYLKKVMDTWKLGGDSKNGLIIAFLFRTATIWRWPVTACTARSPARS